jgi:hypothetical protein
MTKRVLLDACVPAKMRNEIGGQHVVDTARFAGLSRLGNGRLLDAMSGRYDVLVTTDKSLQYQNVISGRDVAVVVMRAKSNDITQLRPLAPLVMRVLATIQSGEVIEVG